MLPKSIWSLKNTIKRHKKGKISKHFFLEKNVTIFASALECKKGLTGKTVNFYSMTGLSKNLRQWSNK